MRTDTIPAPSSASRPAWPAMLFALVVLTGAFSLAGVAMPTTAHAATVVGAIGGAVGGAVGSAGGAVGGAVGGVGHAVGGLLHLSAKRRRRRRI